MKEEPTFGLILLVLNALPERENPPDPTTEEGVQRIAEELVESLIDHWDAMVADNSKIPLLLVSSSCFEVAVSCALGHPVAKKYTAGRLHWIKVPHINFAETKEASSLLPLVAVRNHFLGWMAMHALDVVMVKPFTNFGARLDRRILQYLSQEKPSPLRGSPTDTDQASDLCPLSLEIVPFDGKEGPLLGLCSGDRNSRPAVMPSVEWKRQDYHPQARDERATGTVYLHLPLLRLCIKSSSSDGLTPLDHWSMKPLRRIVESSWQNELEVFEEALRDLVLLLRTRPVNCPAERGLRGLRRSTQP
jgi:hypothetical protein